MIKHIQLFLGPERLRWLFILLATTGLSSLVLNAVVATNASASAWVNPAQTLLAVIFLVGTVVIVFTRLDPFERGRWLGFLVPSLGAIVLGMLFFPNALPLLVGGAMGWVVAGLFIFNPRAPMQYKEAVKHLRKNEYEQAVKAMDTLIKDEPNKANHYRFRAEILRIWGKLDRAKRDYRKMTELEPDSAVAFNGLAEVYLQSGEYAAAREAALKAYSLAPGEWVAAYNLGMIEDRLSDSTAAIDHLNEALKAKVPDMRHRLLIYVYLVRAYARLGDNANAETALNGLRKQQGGLREWQTLFKSEQAETLRKVIEADVQLAEKLINGEQDIVSLAASTPAKQETRR